MFLLSFCEILLQVMGPEHKNMEASQIVGTVSKLNNMNWIVWKFQIKVTLMAKGLYDITSGSEEQPVGDGDLVNWRLKDARAQEVLVMRMEEGPLSHVMQCNSAYDMWVKLESIYDRKSDVSMHLLNEQFYNLKYDNDDINGFVTKVTNLCAKMKQQGEDVPEKMVITKIIMALPEKFKHFRSAWESVPTENQNINHLTARLLIEEGRIGKDREETVALVSRRFEGKCYGCGKAGHSKSRCKRNLECYYCKMKGHLMRDCYKKQKDIAGNKYRGQYNKHNKDFALVSTSNEIKSRVNTDWFLDSGASQHMCKDKELFQNYEVLSMAKNIKIGDGSIMKAIGMGIVRLRAYNGQVFHDVTLYDVLYVPDLEINLFSQGSALDKGLSLVSNSENAQILNSDNKVCAMAVRSGKLFKMLFHVDVSPKSTMSGCQLQSYKMQCNGENCLLAKDNQDLMWWHKTLAHQNFQHVKNILDRNNIDVKESSTFCTSCVLGKHHREPFFC